jgi:hypothetical protein
MLCCLFTHYHFAQCQYVLFHAYKYSKLINKAPNMTQIMDIRFDIDVIVPEEGP